MTAHRSVLDEVARRPPIAGRIRTGIKVLTQAAAKVSGAADVYQAGVRNGLPYSDIEKQLKALPGIEKGPLTPRNTPYFRVSPHDFSTPEIAQQIMDLYGEDRGAGMQLYRFPAIFPFDNWLDCMPHGLRCYTRGGLKYWSEYDAAGKRFCLQYDTQDADNPAAKRARRVWGGRRRMLRPDNNGVCDPAACREYQSGDCKLNGRLLFHIPGIPGAGLIELDTTSFYSLTQIRDQLELIGRIRGGRISGVHNGKAVFYLTKREQEVSRIDNGVAKRTKQFLVQLESDIDMTRVYAQVEQHALPAAERAAAALEGPARQAETHPEEQALPAPAASTPQEPEEPPPAEPPAQGDDDDRAEWLALRARVYDLIQADWREDQAVIDEITAAYGDGWGKNLIQLRKIAEELSGGAA